MVGPKNMHFFTLFQKFAKIKVFEPKLLHSSDFVKIKKKLNSNLNLMVLNGYQSDPNYYFKQLMFHTLSPPVNFVFLVLVLMPRISKADFLQEGMSRIANFSLVLLFHAIPTRIRLEHSEIEKL